MERHKAKNMFLRLVLGDIIKENKEEVKKILEEDDHASEKKLRDQLNSSNFAELIEEYHKWKVQLSKLELQVESFLPVKLQNSGWTDRPRPVFGSGKGLFVISSDFDEPLEDFKEYM